MKKFIFILFVFLIKTQVFCQSYDLLPLDHTDKWYNGKEWSIQKIDDVTIKVYFVEIKSGKALFDVLVLNESDEDVNIDPSTIFMRTIEFDNDGMYSAYKEHKKKDPKSRITQTSFFDEMYRDNDTLYIENSDKLEKNLKAMVTLGVLVDSDNALIGRGFSKMDYYRKNILLKHTIEPNVPHEKLLIIDRPEYPNIVELNILLNGSTFKFQFERDKEG